MKEKNIKILLSIYAIIGVITFGHVWNRPWNDRQIEGGGQCLASMVSSAVWPLYWSVVVWEKNDKQ